MGGATVTPTAEGGDVVADGPPATPVALAPALPLAGEVEADGPALAAVTLT